MNRYEECLEHVKSYVANLRCNKSAIEGLIRSYVEQPGFDIIFRERLVQEAMKMKESL